MFSYKLQDKEKIIAFGRQSESVLIGPVFIILLAIYIPVWLLVRAELLAQYIWPLLIWTVIVLFYGLLKFVTWLTSVYIITNRRAIQILYHSFLTRVENEIQLSDIRGMKITRQAVLGTLFGYADLNLETGQQGGGIKFCKLSETDNLKMSIWKARDALNNVKLTHSSPQSFLLKVKSPLNKTILQDINIK